MTRIAKLPLALICTALALPAWADGPLSFNASLTSDYRYRGISQSRLKPALQGGADFAHDSGFYLGTWGSTIKWIKDSGGDASTEFDFYGGYKKEIAAGLTLDVGLLKYVYFNHELAVSPDTLELYGALSAGPATLKVSRSTSNLFGFSDSKGSMYYDLSATFDLGNGFSLTPHVGRQTVKRNGSYSYTDYSLTLNKTVGAVTWGVAAVDTNTDAYVGAKGKDLGKAGVVLSAKLAF
ncbi:TorF family putative porin [Inhella proteolytica]|uniref:TIGR02001 family outer membrane protein n=1 Tax=Inhella proteolytica TaxID=2795029 RepID=A0A931NE69_9BURK|nr:TorF family putative porin [Inhella proteolytica]MBH9577367.1 hypothetical protein [Inhella proteolytica]